MALHIFAIDLYLVQYSGGQYPTLFGCPHFGGSGRSHSGNVDPAEINDKIIYTLIRGHVDGKKRVQKVTKNHWSNSEVIFWTE